MDLKRLSLYFQKKVGIILLMIVIGAFFGGFVYRMVRSMNMPVEYQAKSKLYIIFERDDTGEAYQYYNGYTWNDLLDTDPIMECIMAYLPDYDKNQVMEATGAEILSDIRLLTITVTGDNEKFVREVLSATDKGLIDYAALVSEELRKIQEIRVLEPGRIYWNDNTTRAAVAGALFFGIIIVLCYGFAYVLNDSVMVQEDVKKRFSYKALGIMAKHQKGLQPYLKELKANIIYLMGEDRKLFLIDVGNHSELRGADFDKLLNWEEGGTLAGDENVGGELIWHVNQAESDNDLFADEMADKEWTIKAMDENAVSAGDCEEIRNSKGAIILVPFGVNVTKRTQRLISFLENQNCPIMGIVISEADDEYLIRYFA